MNIVFVTGACRGIGKGLCLKYLEEGWKVYAACRTEGSLAHLEFEEYINTERLKIVYLDLAVPNYIDKCVESDHLDLLINNAGVCIRDEDKYQTWLTTFSVNVISPYFLARNFRHKLKNGNNKLIINISSHWGSISCNDQGDYVAYRASKAALNSVTKSLSNEFSQDEIFTVSIRPGWVKTDMGGGMGQLTITDSCDKLFNTISKIKVTDSGKFIDINGENIPW